MSQTTFSVRMNTSLKEEFSSICKEIGLNMSKAINIFASAVVNKRMLPFDIETPSIELLEYKNALDSMRTKIESSKTKKMSLNEINSIITSIRKNRKSK